MDHPVSHPVHRVALSESQIDAVVARFYARVRVHPVLGPIFNDAVSLDAKAWRLHEAKIARFWRNVLLRQPVYSGNPMAVHAANPDVTAAHFDIWLALFDEVLTETLPFAAAQSWSRLAHRVGRGLSLGLDVARSRTGGVPNLTG